jgi:hypothetical protein
MLLKQRSNPHSSSYSEEKESRWRLHDCSLDYGLIEMAKTISYRYIHGEQDLESKLSNTEACEPRRHI